VWHGNQFKRCESDMKRLVTMANRPRLYLAESYDARAQIGVIVVEFRGDPSRFSESVVQHPPSPATLVEFGLAAARAEHLRDFDLFLTARVRPLCEKISEGSGAPRIRWVARRKNLIARTYAHARLRSLVPRPLFQVDDESCVTADCE
jgi:hypothetical protein